MGSKPPENASQMPLCRTAECVRQVAIATRRAGLKTG